MNTQLKLFENTGGYFLLKFFEIVILRNHASHPFQKLGLGNKLQFTIKDKETTFLQFSTLQNPVVISGCKGLKRRWNLQDITPTSLRLIFLTQLPTQNILHTTEGGVFLESTSTMASPAPTNLLAPYYLDQIQPDTEYTSQSSPNLVY